MLGALPEVEYVISSFHAGIRWDVRKTGGKGAEGSSSLYKQTTSLNKKAREGASEREGNLVIGEFPFCTVRQPSPHERYRKRAELHFS